MKGRLFVFCGIPGSGKTTIAKRVAQSIERSMLIQTDGVRTMLTRPTYSGDESRFVYDACFAVAKEALARGYSVILDGTFMREEYRSEARKLLGKHSSRMDTVWVDCTLEAALKRNARREAKVPPERVERMFTGFEPPRRALRVDSSRLSPDAAAKRIGRALL